MPGNRLRIGVLGAGRRGTEHIRSILALPELYEPAAVCDVSPAAAAAAGALTSARVHTSVTDFLSRENLDVVVITTPRETHHRGAGNREDLVRLYYETEPPLEFRNPFAGRSADDGDPRKLYDELARAAELESIHRAVTTGGEPDYGITQARRDMELSILLTESSRRCQPLPPRSDTLGPETAWEREQYEEFRRTYGADPIKDLDRLTKSSDWLGSSL